MHAVSHDRVTGKVLLSAETEIGFEKGVEKAIKKGTEMAEEGSWSQV